MTAPRYKDRYEGYFDEEEHAIRGSSLAHVAAMCAARIANAEIFTDGTLPELPVSLDMCTLPPAEVA